MEIKPIFGKMFSFPENETLEFDNLVNRITHKAIVQFVEEYDEYIVSQIANTARENGISELVVLNKWAILNAIKKQIPQKPWYRREGDAKGWACPACHMGVTVDHGRIKDTFCSHCGQALDWEEA